MRAINDGVIEIPEVTPGQRNKLVQLGIPVDNVKLRKLSYVKVASPERIKKVKEALRLYYEEELTIHQVGLKMGEVWGTIQAYVTGETRKAITQPIIEEYRKQGKEYRGRERKRRATQTAREQTT